MNPKSSFPLKLKPFVLMFVFIYLSFFPVASADHVLLSRLLDHGCSCGQLVFTFMTQLLDNIFAQILLTPA